jgi:ankyrin repeat protein
MVDPDLSRRIAEEMFGPSRAKPPTPLMLACRDEDAEKALPLIAKSRTVGKPDPIGRTPLHEAVRYAYRDGAAAFQIVMALLDRGAPVDPVDASGHTPLMEAAIYGYPDLVRLLLARGADANVRESSGLTAIGAIEATASLRGRRRKIVKILEDAGGVR